MDTAAVSLPIPCALRGRGETVNLVGVQNGEPLFENGVVGVERARALLVGARRETRAEAARPLCARIAWADPPLVVPLGPWVAQATWQADRVLLPVSIALLELHGAEAGGGGGQEEGSREGGSGGNDGEDGEINEDGEGNEDGVSSEDGESNEDGESGEDSSTDDSGSDDSGSDDMDTFALEMLEDWINPTGSPSDEQLLEYMAHVMQHGNAATAAGGERSDHEQPSPTAREEAACAICFERGVAMMQSECRHNYCLGCLARWAESAAGLPVAAHNPRLLRCPEEGCLAGIDAEQLAPEIGPARTEVIRRRLDEYASAHSMVAACPLCEEESQISWADAPEGQSVVRCAACAVTFCQHCLSVTLPGPCSACAARQMVPMAPEPMSTFSHTMCLPGGGVARWWEFAPGDVLARLEELCAGQVHARCPCCAASLHRTTECNQLTHCSVSICDACGWFTLPGQAMVDHYHPHRCPRYFFDGPEGTPGLWLRSTMPAMPSGEVCQQGACHDAAKDCQNPAHAAFRANLNAVRRALHVSTLLDSLPPSLSFEVMELVHTKGSEALKSQVCARNRAIAANRPRWHL